MLADRPHSFPNDIVLLLPDSLHMNLQKATKISKNETEGMMSTLLVFFFLFAACITISAGADAPFCRRLHHKRHYYAYCYQESIYTRCKNTCGELLLGRKYVMAGCPWGNNANILSESLDLRCRKKITSARCFEYCVNPLMDKIRIGWECCKDCVRVCGKMPPRDVNFQQRYPTVYPRK